MAVSHPVPVRGVAERVRFEFFVAATDAPFSGTLTGLSATVSKDDAAPVASTNALTQVGTSAIAYLDLTVAEMTTTATCALPVCTNPGVYAAMVEIIPSQDQPVTLTAAIVQQIERSYLMALASGKMDDGSTFTLLDTDNVTPIATALVSTQNGVNYMGPLIFLADLP